MTKRRRIDDENESTPRPISTYLLLGLVVVVVVVGAYMNRDAITAFVTDVVFAPPSTVSIDEPLTIAAPEPTCAAACGRACWLVVSGAAEGTFESAQGKIGTLGCNGNCWSVADVVSSVRCCHNSDCAKSTLCKDGVCK